ncbi:uncharacterized protein LOC119401263 isoform X2 [Rhipicephalus sanguineus]|nr:uncharacterized protein LOC119401263 isoform X2 [Rhipicephalus sanguineus]XP_037523875.1 uncharacterized protein LOC119401263 isoform X2 [Rhipicephalus sanguineus]XP_037523877.1 uncharacterized protein LOC119401263 isoform X2 [Rhipicephalus sanguineus]
MKFSVVEFKDDKSIAVVPSSWIRGRKCFWPPGPGSKTAMVQKGVQPSPRWKAYAMLMKATFNNYRDARLALPRLQYTSELESTGGGKRKVTKPTRYEPEHNRQPPRPPSTFPGPSVASHEEPRSEDSEDVPVQVDADAEDEGVLLELHGETPEGHATGESFAAGDAEFAAAGTGQPHKKKVMSQEEFQRQVLTQLAGLRVVQQQQGQLLGDLVTRFARRNMEAQANSEPLVAMPFDDYGTLKQFDCTLTGTRKEVFIRELAVKGGANPAACTKRMLRYVMTDHLACQFSWQGRKGKLSFCQMQLPSCITCAVQTAHEASDFTVEMAIREWLRHAPARQRNAIAKDSAAE